MKPIPLLLFLAGFFIILPTQVSASVQADSLLHSGVDAPRDETAKKRAAGNDFNNILQQRKRFIGQRLIVQPSTFEMPDGTVSYRGLGTFNGFSPIITLNGQRLASTGFESRATHFESLPSHLFSKATFRNADGHRLVGSGGLLELTTLGTDETLPTIQLDLGGGLQTHNRGFLSPDSRLSLIYSGVYGDNARFTAGVYQNRHSFGQQALQVTFANTDFGSGPADVIDRVSPSAVMQSQVNQGMFFNSAISTSENSTYRISGFLNQGTYGSFSHRYLFNSAGDWLSPGETGAIGNRGQLDYFVGSEEAEIVQTALSAEARYQLERSELRFLGGWSFGGHTSNELTVPFRATSLNYAISENGNGLPTMEITNRTVQDQDLRLEQMTDITFGQNEHLVNAGIDFKHHFSNQTTLKSGFLFTNINKKGTYKNAGLRLLALSSVASFRHMNGHSLKPFDEPLYEFGTLVSPNDARRFFQNNYSLFRQNMREQIRNSDDRNYGSSEKLYAGNVSLSTELDAFSIVAGSRIEFLQGRYSGKWVEFNDIGNHTGTVDTTATNSYVNILPFLTATLRIKENVSAQAGFSSAATPQSHRALTPYRLVDMQAGEVFTGNSQLKPLNKYTVDAHLHWVAPFGLDVRTGGFHTILKNATTASKTTITDAAGNDLALFSLANSSKDASISGLEASVGQSFHFLPGFLRHTGLQLNGTMLQSSYSPENGLNGKNLPGVPDYVLGFALWYHSNSVRLMASFNHVSAYTFGYRSFGGDLNFIDAGMPVEVSSTSYSNISASAQVRLGRSLSVWVDASNMLQNDWKQYSVAEDVYPWDHMRRNRAVIMTGIQLEF